MGRPKRRTTTATTGAVSTSYGMGVLTDGTAITFLGDVSGGVINFLSATIQTPVALVGRKIQRDATTTNVWRLV